jgi:hypothetical protein
VVLLYDPLYGSYLRPGKPAASLKPHGLKPELGDILVTLHMHVLRLVSVAGIEEQPIGSDSENRRHLPYALTP